MPAGGEEGTAHVNGVDLYYTVYGEGDPVMLLHRGLANGAYWANQIPALPETHRVIVLDSRGHGRSSFDETPITYDPDGVGRARIARPSRHRDGTDIVGWSDGGIIGLDIALSNPDRLNKVVAYGANFDPNSGGCGSMSQPTSTSMPISTRRPRTISPPPRRRNAGTNS